jgi:uncharacterized membrane protein YkvA (DUF1232 family)
MVEDPFPRERFSALVRHLPAYARLAWRLGRDPILSRKRRAAVAGAAGYLLSPVDLVPGVIPVLGQIDDLLVALAAIKLALDGLNPDRRQAHLAAVGLTEHDVADDFRATGAIGMWVLRAGARAGVAAAGSVGRAVMRGAGGAASTADRMRAAAVGDLGPAAARVGAELDRRVPERVRREVPRMAEAAAGRLKSGIDRIPGPRVHLPSRPAFPALPRLGRDQGTTDESSGGAAGDAAGEEPREG